MKQPKAVATRCTGNTLRFAVVLVVVNLHQLRNLSLLLYLALYVPMVGYLVIQYCATSKTALLHKGGTLFHVWVAMAVVGLLTSLVLVSPIGAAFGLVRFLFASPVFIALVLYTPDARQFARHILTACVAFTLASLTLPLQFVTGPIPWFAAASERGGLERYSSLVGSLTALGIAVGCYMVLLQGAHGGRRFMWIMLPLMVAPALLALSKAAVANIALATLALGYLNRRSLSRWAATLVAGVGVSFLAIARSASAQERVFVVLQSFGLRSQGDRVNYDVGIGDGLADRVTGLPLENILALAKLDTPFVYLIGGGFGMGGTALVPEPDVLAPQAHNQFVELLTVFGPLVAAVQVAVLLIIGRHLLRGAKRHPYGLYGAVLASFVLLLGNAVTANGTLYQPAAATAFYLAFFLALSTRVSATEGASVVAGVPPTTANTAGPSRASGRNYARSSGLVRGESSYVYGEISPTGSFRMRRISGSQFRPRAN